MSKLRVIKENIIDNKWMEIKKIHKSNNPNIEILDKLTQELLADLSELTIKGYTEIENVSIDTYKDRVWRVVELNNLLPEYKDEGEDILEDIKDSWEDEDDSFEIDDSLFYKLK